MTAVEQTAVTARRAMLAHADAMRLARDEYLRFADAVTALDGDDWTAPTECAGWTVHDLVAHVVGMSTMASSPLENVRQTRAARKRLRPGRQLVDAVTAYQVERFGQQTTDQLVRSMAAIAPKAAAARRRTPGLLRNRTIPEQQLVNGTAERWTIGYAIDTILTRDPWMHRIDLARATGHVLVLTDEHDGAIVADVVQEWAARHNKPFDLCLTGAAGGRWHCGTTDERLDLDAVEFCRILSGRAEGAGLLTTQVPF
ncbi:maleylpyruvate isomerase family mycothiol-dependent enzyme [Nocardia sp. NPDC060220]|uniref:maleylpyruvate isomerase family mycothiol-dependent enzyme n=1 Tax=Nocardia sp. NPDC060220 TaxID=3347076 RepID=UPI00364F0BFA